MFFKYNKVYENELETAFNGVKKDSKDWSNLISKNTQSIKEINALPSEEREMIKKELINLISSIHPEIDAPLVTEELLNFENTEYHSYLKNQSKGFTKETANRLGFLAEEKYAKIMDEFVQEQTFNTNFAVYYNKVNKFSLELETAFPFSYKLRHKTSLTGNLRPFSNPEEKLIEKDEVKMQEHTEDIKPDYFKLLSSETLKDGEKIYESHLENFNNTMHFPGVEGVDDFLSAF
jgi:hypothetical protein